MKEIMVEFIGSGYEAVKFVKVKASSFKEAFERAEEWYHSTNQVFAYNEMEVRRN